MKTLLNFLSGQPLAVLPEALEGFLGLLERRIEDPDLDMKALFGGANEAPADYQLLDGGIALVLVEGSLAKKSYWYSCATSMADIKAMVQQALDDPRVNAILLDVDSPGGTVTGTRDLAGFLSSAGEQKPLYAYTDGQMASAAYWIGSAARTIWAMDTANVGSIGVLAVHIDRSQADAQRGIKRTYVTAGAWKAKGNDAEPLDAETQKYFEDRLGAVYQVFLEDVAANRGVSMDKATAMADGKIFNAREALSAGLIDGVGTLDQFVQLIRKEVSAMDYSTLKAQHPDLFQQVRAEGAQEEQARTDAARAESVKAEGERLVGLAGALFGEASASRLKTLAASGATPEMVRTMKEAVGAGDEARGQGQGDTKDRILQELKDGSPSPVKTGAAAEGPGDFMALVDARKKEAGCSTKDAMSWVVRNHPEAHEKYLKGGK